MYAVPTCLHELRRKGVFSPLVELPHVSTASVSFSLFRLGVVGFPMLALESILSARYTHRGAFGQTCSHSYWLISLEASRLVLQSAVHTVHKKQSG
ncbi:Piso0_001404 [Millerozyma farinosa CBS 7064]|uniref:Piso0_001404 protein n=1 Tax=Pichia sorbitophila (strain ATCC MYA-4447 / BCRC 22081 / CBS 7064 / NBRC 10061 / NRRL Y-12695) TaxID=559304 RepID=G8YN29_PICSO|nr:Piso0_001404 [Millerozyma farinosa CBS 7064]